MNSKFQELNNYISKSYMRINDITLSNLSKKIKIS